MMKQKLNWRRSLFYLLFPIFFIMVFLGFPLPGSAPAVDQTWAGNLHHGQEEEACASAVAGAQGEAEDDIRKPR